MTQEAQLVAQLKDKTQQEQAFRTLVVTYQERLYWHIRRIVLNHDDADDVLQNTFIKIFKNIHNFKENSALYSWMYRIATNESITFLNNKAKKYSLTTQELQEKMVSNLTSDVYFDGDQAQLTLQKALATLPEKQRLVFNMKYFENMKYDEIAEVLETSVGALKASYHHAVKKIEEYITNQSN